MSGNDVENGFPAALPPPEPMFELNTSQSGVSVDDENPGLDRGHSLPNVDDLKMDAKTRTSEAVGEDGEVQRRGGWVVMLALCLAVVIIAVIIGVAVAITQQQNSKVVSSASQNTNTNPVPSPTTPVVSPTSATLPTSPSGVAPSPTAPSNPAPAPTTGTQDRTTEIKNYLFSQGISTSGSLNQNGSPQQRALNWLANVDGAALAVPGGDKTTPEGYNFVTRYVLAVLYYQTLGDRWVYSLNFLQPFDLCYWYSVLQYPDGTQEFRGVACAENGQIAALFLSKHSSRWLVLLRRHWLTIPFCPQLATTWKESFPMN